MGRRVVNDTEQANPSGLGVLVCGSCSCSERGCHCAQWRPVWRVLPDVYRLRAVIKTPGRPDDFYRLDLVRRVSGSGVAQSSPLLSLGAPPRHSTREVCGMPGAALVRRGWVDALTVRPLSA